MTASKQIKINSVAIACAVADRARRFGEERSSVRQEKRRLFHIARLSKEED